MMKTLNLVAAVAAALFAVPAFAQDTAGPSGPRVEARVGWDHVVISADYDDGVDSFEDSVSKSGVNYGVEAGYDIVSGNTLLGIYAGIEDSSTKECSEVLGEDRACLRSGRNITVGGRVGFMANPTSVVYVKGGYSNGRATVDYEDFEGIIESGKVSKNLDGFHLGAGGEFGFGRPGLYGKLEYVYTNHGKASIEVEDISAGAKLERHQVVAGVR